MRILLFILLLTAVAGGLVKLRRDEVVARHEIQQLQTRLFLQRRRLWDLDVRLGTLTAVDAIRTRAEEMGLTLVPPGEQDIPRLWPNVLAQAPRN